MSRLLVQLITYVAKAICLIILFIMLVYGSNGIGEVLKYFGIESYFLQYILTIYALGMFGYEINKANKNS